MSTLWTPGGEHPVGRQQEPAGGPQRGAPQPGGLAGGQPSPGGAAPQSEEELRAQLAAFQEELARTPAEVVVANHAFGLFELAALHLSRQPAQLEQARLAIDALAALVDALGSRLGDAGPQLSEGLAQLRLAFVQVHAAQAPPAPGAGGGTPTDGSPGGA